jgi:hypothetical protein
MGLDLRLLPCERWNEESGRVWGFSHTILDLGRVDQESYDAFEEMVKPHLAPMPADHDVSSFVGARVPDGRHEGEHTYGTIRDKDAYGQPYQVVAAEHLLPWIVEHFQYDGCRGGGPYQTAIVAYLRALPPTTKIVLDWH